MKPCQLRDYIVNFINAAEVSKWYNASLSQRIQFIYSSTKSFVRSSTLFQNVALSVTFWDKSYMKRVDTYGHQGRRRPHVLALNDDFTRFSNLRNNIHWFGDFYYIFIIHAHVSPCNCYTKCTEFYVWRYILYIKLFKNGMQLTSSWKILCYHITHTHTLRKPVEALQNS